MGVKGGNDVVLRSPLLAPCVCPGMSALSVVVERFCDNDEAAPVPATGRG